jgi:hypothetical protein
LCVPVSSLATVNFGVNVPAAGKPAVGSQLSVIKLAMLPAAANALSTVKQAAASSVS